ncbi:hypothetical protein EK21DRAFT_92085 [Setomelanomma holmii]|uniref:Uncharacterized protein n=1 Tax=Setomelanomma holmii TaxID=210430 RepID=A0A9P4LIQ1_9PLEO|nr:hypothetical protein EK21DRAFT_92085 [Setomelanomma holmii]
MTAPEGYVPDCDNAQPQTHMIGEQLPRGARTWWSKCALTKSQVAYIVFRQWLFARNFERDMNDAFEHPYPARAEESSLRDLEMGDEIRQTGAHDISNNEDNMPKPTSKRAFRWTRVHSHFALMVGFTFDSSASQINIFPEGRTRLTLTVPALQKITAREPSLIPDKLSTLLHAVCCLII